MPITIIFDDCERAQTILNELSTRSVGKQIYLIHENQFENSLKIYPIFGQKPFSAKNIFGKKNIFKDRF